MAHLKLAGKTIRHSSLSNKNFPGNCGSTSNFYISGPKRVTTFGAGEERIGNGTTAKSECSSKNIFEG
jgi:hypothetical protein